MARGAIIAAMLDAAVAARVQAVDNSEGIVAELARRVQFAEAELAAEQAGSAEEGG